MQNLFIAEYLFAWSFFLVRRDQPIYFPATLSTIFITSAVARDCYCCWRHHSCFSIFYVFFSSFFSLLFHATTSSSIHSTCLLSYLFNSVRIHTWKKKSYDIEYKYVLNTLASSVWATGIHMDGEAKAWRQLFIASCTKWKACCCLFDLIACRHNNGLFEWILCASASAGFLCGVAESDRAGHNNENDSTGSNMGTARDLHSGTFPF